jgi:hypothetical protein
VSVLRRIQRLLESVYHLDVPEEVGDFTIGARELGELVARGAAPVGAPEQLLVLEEEGETSLALFIDDAVLERLRESDPLTLTPENRADFCLLAEGVSHFVYFIWKAHRGEPVTKLELELQAEVDKYIACLFSHWEHDRSRFPEALKEDLFVRVRFRPDLGDQESDRYRTANHLAMRYCDYLERSFLREGMWRRAMPELRRFYRLGHTGKLAHIAVR